MVIFFQRWDGNIIFSGHHCHRWFSNGFVTFRPSPLNVFSQLNHWKRCFFMVYQILGMIVNSHRWLRSWKNGNFFAFLTFEISQQFFKSVQVILADFGDIVRLFTWVKHLFSKAKPSHHIVLFTTYFVL